MAYCYVEVYVNDKMIRKYGGNNSDVRYKTKLYNEMSFEEFFLKNNWLCKSLGITEKNFFIETRKYKKNRRTK